MHTKIEAKLKVDSLQEVERKLGEVGVEFVEQQLQTDTYFDDAGDVLKGSDRALRLRRQRDGQKENTFLTYKGAKEKNDFKKRREIEIEVGDGELVEKLFSELGYEKALVFEKKCRIVSKCSNNCYFKEEPICVRTKAKISIYLYLLRFSF